MCMREIFSHLKKNERYVSRRASVPTSKYTIPNGSFCSLRCIPFGRLIDLLDDYLRGSASSSSRIYDFVPTQLSSL